MRDLTNYREFFDQAARSFGSEPFSSTMLKERVVRLNPRFKIRSDMVSRWSATMLDEKKIEVTGRGPNNSLVFRTIGELGEMKKPVEDEEKLVEEHVGCTEIRKTVAEQFASQPFSSATLRAELCKRYPNTPLSKIQGNLGYWLNLALKSGEIEIATPEKRCRRSYQVPQKTVAEPVEVVPPREELPVVPSDPTKALVFAFSNWMHESMKVSVEAMQKAIAEQTARFERLLTEVRVATIEELAASLPNHPRLFAAIQEVKREEMPEVTAKTPLPHQVSIYNMRYDRSFVDTYTHLASNEKELVKKSIHLLANNGSHYPSLSTKKLDLEVPGTPRGAYVSRAGDLRFTWEKKGTHIEYFNIFRRGDAPLVYGAE